MRLRLSLLYGALFVASGAVLLVITNLLVRHATGNFLFIQSTGSDGSTAGVISGDGPKGLANGPALVTGPASKAAQQVQQLIAQAHHQHARDAHQLLVQSLIALAIMTVVSVGLGWLVAGRALRPLRTITTAARNISANNLHQRLALSGPDDELKELGDTFDALIARLERSFQSQRQFVANASHELRTPLTLQHALLEAALLDPDATSAGLASSRLHAHLRPTRSRSGSSQRSSHSRAANVGSVIANRSTCRPSTTEVLAGREADFARRGLTSVGQPRSCADNG